MDIYFEPSVAGLHGHLISGSNPVGLVCPGGWQQALSDWLCGIFIKCEECGGNKTLLYSCRKASGGEVSEISGKRGSVVFPLCFLEFSENC